MGVIDEVVASNQAYQLTHDPTGLTPRPTRKLAVLTCMDTRLRLEALGLKPQDAHFIRNAGGIVTEDTLRSLLVSHYSLGTEEIMVINHTDCGMSKMTEQEFHKMIEGRAGVSSSSEISFHAFKDVEENVRQQMRKLHEHSWIHDELVIRGFVYDVHDGHLREVTL